MAGFHTYKPFLSAALSTVNPKRVLEWGPGKSTLQILTHPSVESVFSVEHNSKWYEKYKALTQDVRVCLILETNFKNYVQLPSGIFDLIFIDGRRRTQCIIRALDLISDDGIVLVHDAERESYWPSIEQWPFCKFSEEQEVVAMSKSQTTIEKWYDRSQASS